MEEYLKQSRHLLSDHEHQILDESEDRSKSAIFTWKNTVLLAIVWLLGYIALRVTFHTYPECTCGHSATTDESYIGSMGKRSVLSLDTN